MSTGTFVFRKGKKGDKPTPGWCAPLPGEENEEGDLPDFVLELDGKQVAAASTEAENHIFLIGSYIQNKGYGTKFLEEWEKYATAKGHSEVIVSQVCSDPLEHILDKLGYSFVLDEFNEKTYRKKLKS